MSSIDTTIALVRTTIQMRRGLVDALRDQGGAFASIAKAFEEDVRVLEMARDALVAARGKKGGR